MTDAEFHRALQTLVHAYTNSDIDYETYKEQLEELYKLLEEDV
jgi:hypothetical protein